MAIDKAKIKYKQIQRTTSSQKFEKIYERNKFQEKHNLSKATKRNRKYDLSHTVLNILIHIINHSYKGNTLHTQSFGSVLPILQEINNPNLVQILSENKILKRHTF